MVEQLGEMPPGTIGFRIGGTIDRVEYHRMLDPVKEALDRGERVSFLVETTPDFHGLDMPALWEDVKAAGSIGLQNRTAWERIAGVTDKDWMRHAISGFGWVMPGEVKVFEPGELDAAKAWIGAGAPS